MLRTTGEGPDFSVKVNDETVWIEATAPGIGDVDPAPERIDIKPGEFYSGGGDMEENYRTKILRLASAIRNKSNKVESSQYYKGKNKGLIGEKDPYVIAVNGYEFSGHVSDPMFLLRRTLFAAGCLARGQFDTEFHYLHKPFVVKNKIDGTTENIPTDIFTNDGFEEVSAIIYSHEHVINTTDDLSKPGSSLILIRNPFAKNSLPKDFPWVGRELVYEGGAITEINSITE